MQQVTTIGLDLAKNLFQVHGADAQGRPVLKRRLAREKVLEVFANLPPCLVGLEACAAAHYWARELRKLGHEVRLMPPQYVRPYVKTNKHDAADAEAICEAVTRPGMRFVPVKEEGQQALLMLHRAPGAGAAAQAAHRDDQRLARPPGRVRHRRRAAADRPAGAVGRGRRS